jgi:D-sedoheptulose 7-phosphate isomerase
VTQQTFARNYLDGLCGVLPRLNTDAIHRTLEAMQRARDAGRTIYSCGNGGSASVASQMVVDIVKGASYGREKRMKMMALTDSVATITALANDVDYESVFVEPLRNFAVEGDVLIAISGSGNSANVLRAVEYANEVGVTTVGLTTSTGGRLKDLARIPILVPTDHMGHLEDAFFVITHILVYAFIERAY